MVRKPKPWAYGNSPLSLRELQQMCREFWHNTIRAGGRRDIWDALRATTEGNLLNAQKIIEDKNIRHGNQDMSVCYDDNARFCYCIVEDNDNITFRVDEKGSAEYIKIQFL
ncbi:ubiquitin domain-containing protein 1 [Tanacetum coccineum]